MMAHQHDHDHSDSSSSSGSKNASRPWWYVVQTITETYTKEELKQMMGVALDPNHTEDPTKALVARMKLFKDKSERHHEPKEEQVKKRWSIEGGYHVPNLNDLKYWIHTTMYLHSFFYAICGYKFIDDPVNDAPEGLRQWRERVPGLMMFYPFKSDVIILERPVKNQKKRKAGVLAPPQPQPHQLVPRVLPDKQEMAYRMFILTFPRPNKQALPFDAHQEYQNFMHWAQPFTSGIFENSMHDYLFSLLQHLQYGGRGLGGMIGAPIWVHMGMSHLSHLTIPGEFAVRISSSVPKVLTIDFKTPEGKVESLQVNVGFNYVEEEERLVPVFYGGEDIATGAFQVVVDGLRPKYGLTQQLTQEKMHAPLPIVTTASARPPQTKYKRRVRGGTRAGGRGHNPLGLVPHPSIVRAARRPSIARALPPSITHVPQPAPPATTNPPTPEGGSWPATTMTPPTDYLLMDIDPLIQDEEFGAFLEEMDHGNTLSEMAV